MYTLRCENCAYCANPRQHWVSAAHIVARKCANRAFTQKNHPFRWLAYYSTKSPVSITGASFGLRYTTSAKIMLLTRHQAMASLLASKSLA